MNNINLGTLVKKAGEMALGNIWGEETRAINMAILEIDHNNIASCTRLAKYYKLNDNIAEAKNMYLRALDIDPNSRIANNNLQCINNLQSIEKSHKENEVVEKIINTMEVVHMGDKKAKKKEEKKKPETSAINLISTPMAPVKKAKKTY